MEYPKINSLYKRDPKTHALIPGQYSCPEFDVVKTWSITEKIDGTNIRIEYDANLNTLELKGRTKDAQMPVALNEWFSAHPKMNIDSFRLAFPDVSRVILFGEGYGPKINSGGWYRKDTSVILFDVIIGRWWLTRDGVRTIALQLAMDFVPELMTGWSLDQIVSYIKGKPLSKESIEPRMMEGVIARAEPLMLFRDGRPVMFKLKCKDMV